MFGGGLVMTSSFGVQSAVMLHLVTQISPGIPVVFIDTGYLFPETYRFADELTRRLKLDLKVYQPLLTAARYEALHGRQWETDVQGMIEYNKLRKVEPMQRAIRDLNVTAWLAGLRREQTDHRGGLRIVELQDGIYKVHPILNWTTKDVHEYLKKHDLPYHPLYEKGYHSIGDVHSTDPTFGDGPERQGRFRGLKQECGLHLPASREEDQSRSSSDL
jgi:phosphoadenosine phosphosulfate reductase